MRSIKEIDLTILIDEEADIFTQIAGQARQFAVEACLLPCLMSMPGPGFDEVGHGGPGDFQQSHCLLLHILPVGD